jgi:hypothetical protein
MKVPVQLAAGTSAEWNASNPKLYDSVLAVEKLPDGTFLFKMGDGDTRWAHLPYLNGDNLLDGKKTLTLALQEIRSALAAETARAKNAEEDLEESIAAEKARAEGAEEDLEESITVEKARALAAEDALGEALDSERARAENAEGVLTEALDSEKARARTAEGALTEALDSEKARARAVEDALTGMLANESVRAKNAEDALTGMLANESVRAENAEDVLTEALASEKARAEGAESALNRKAEVIEAESIERDDAHAALTAAHGSAFQPAKNRIAMFDNTRKLRTGNPATQPGDVVRYDEFYVFEKLLGDIGEAMPPLIVDREGNFIVSRGGLLIEAV